MKTVLPPPPKVDGRYVFAPICLVSVCEQDISKSCGRIRTTLAGKVGHVTRMNRFDFQDPDPDTSIFLK